MKNDCALLADSCKHGSEKHGSVLKWIWTRSLEAGSGSKQAGNWVVSSPVNSASSE